MDLIHAPTPVCGQSPDIARMKLEAAVEPEVLILQPPSIR